MIVDAEKITSAYLREATDARVVGKTPGNVTESWVLLTMLDAPQDPRSPADHLVGYLLQLDCYAGATGGQPEAVLLGRTVRAALEQMPARAHDEAVVTSVRINGHARIPDTDFEPARERVMLTATVHAHPA